MTPETPPNPKLAVRCPRCQWRGRLWQAFAGPNDLASCPVCGQQPLWKDQDDAQPSHASSQ